MAKLDDELGPLGPPPPLPRRRGSELTTGMNLDPVRRIAAFSPADLESLVEYWLRGKVDGRFGDVVKFGGKGDKGRDVVGYVNADHSGEWDNFQCKHYAKKLSPKTLYFELGKLVYWTMKGTYSTPRAYTFVAPKGVSSESRDLLDDPERLRKKLEERWGTSCASLCDFEEVAEHLIGFTFPELDVVDGGRIVDELKGNSVYPYFFGGGLSKPRPEVPLPPPDIGVHELRYVNALVDAYDEHCESSIDDSDEALAHETYGDHLRTSRKEFFSAEALREFSKDVLPAPSTFEELQDQIHNGIRHKVAASYPSGYDRALEVCAHATVVQLAAHPLSEEVRPEDRSGICHQLANEGRLKWRRL